MPLHRDQRWTVEHAPRLGYHVMHDDDTQTSFEDGRQFTQDLDEAQALAAKLNEEGRQKAEAEGAS